MSAEWHDEISDALSILRGQRQLIDDLADALGFVGNVDLAKKLASISRALSEAHDLAKHGLHTCVGEMCAASSEASTNMIRAALAGIKIGENAQ